MAVTIWRPATNTEYRTCTIAALFGLGRSTVGEIVLETCEMIAQHLLPLYIAVPRSEGLQEIVVGFKNRLDFPQVFGAIDGTHIYPSYDHRRVRLLITVIAKVITQS